MEIEIKSRYTGSVILSGEADSLRDFVEKNKLGLIEANLAGADLIRADLTGADLTGADLTRADLIRANLTRADLTGADLIGADLTRADLTGADLTRADLVGADLTGADLTRADLAGADLTGADLAGANLTGVSVPMFCSWLVSYKVSSNEEKIMINDIKLSDIEIIIGCKSKTIQEWNEWFQSDEEFETKRNTFEFKQIQAMYLAYKTYLEFLYN